MHLANSGNGRGGNNYKKRQNSDLRNENKNGLYLLNRDLFRSTFELVYSGLCIRSQSTKEADEVVAEQIVK